MVKTWLIRVVSLLAYYSGFINFLRFLGRDNVKILLYHSIDAEESSFTRGTGMRVTPEMFEKHMNYIQKHYTVISVRELVESLEADKLLRNKLAVTFDDGFADNLINAYPVLERLGLPATIFLNPGNAGNGRLNWIQELCYLVNTVGASTVSSKLASLRDDFKMESLENMTLSDADLYRTIQDYLVYSTNKLEREEIIDRLYDSSGINRQQVPGRDTVFLSWEQVSSMAGNGISFGNHGLSHTSLSTMQPEEQKTEILESQKLIRENLDCEFVPFSFPFGQVKDIPPGSKDLIKSSGHRCALTAIPILNHPDVSPFELGRIPVGDIPVFHFAFELEMGTLKKIIGWKNHEEE
jgi:peptidoglycan/xylan/chitin deacetylase (PgdA/CDA1 family)